MSAATIEHSKPVASSAEQGQKEVGMFFAGAGGRRKVLGPVRTLFEDKFGSNQSGEPNYRIDGSALFGDPHSPEKWREASQFIVDQVNSGNRVRVISHSLGAAEGVEVIRGTEAIEDGFLEANRGKISMLPYSPATLNENIFQGIAYALRYPKVLFDEMARLPFFKSGFNRIIVSWTTMPPAGELKKQIRFKEGLRRVFAKRSHYDGTLPEQQYETTRDYLSLIEPEMRGKVDELDQQAFALMDEPANSKKEFRKNKRKLKKVGKERAKVTKKVITDIYDDLRYADHFGDKPPEGKTYKRSFKGFMSKLGLIRKTFLSGKMYRQFMELLEKGVVLEQINLPEYDVLLKKKRIPKALIEKTKVIYGNHTSPPVAQPEAFVTS